MTEKERLQLRLQPETREKIERWQSAAGCRSMNEFVEKAVNFYADYLASDDTTTHRHGEHYSARTATTSRQPCTSRPRTSGGMRRSMMKAIIHTST